MKSANTQALEAYRREQRELVLRMVVFCSFAAMLAALSGYFVFNVLTDHSEVGLSATDIYTVRVALVPEESSEDLRRVKPTFADLLELDPDRFFIVRTGEGEVALCAGRFDSPDAEQARSLLSRVRGCEHGGTAPFREADIWFVSAGGR